MASAVDAIPWSSSDLIPNPRPQLSDEWSRAIKKTYGKIPPYVASMTVVPWLARGHIDSAFAPIAFVPRDLADMIAVIVSQDNSCRHCYGAMRMLLRLFGYSEDQVRQLEADLQQSDLPPATREALEFARQLSRANPRADKARLERLAAAGFSRDVITEIAVVAAYWTIGNRVASFLALAPDPMEGVVGKWYMPLVSVLARLMMSGKRKVVPRRSMPPELRGGAFGMLAGRLDGIPLGVSIAQMLQESLESNILPRRTKLLMMAVISRTVMCPLCESGAEHLLAEEGFSAEQTQVVLKNLASPDLTALEAKLIPLARETVRYQPQQIQEKLRELQKEITPAEFMEFIGVAAIANCAARLTVILQAE